VTAVVGRVNDDAPMSDTDIRSGLARRGLHSDSNQFSRKVWRPLWRHGAAFDEPPVERPADRLRDQARDDTRRGTVIRPNLKRPEPGPA